MIVKEKDAGTKWCPMTRFVIVADRDVLSANRPVDGDGDVKIVPGNACIGSRCMMWVSVNDKTGRCGMCYGA
jgi:hypothetical protein